jgi:hypothetical protein
MGNLSRCPQLIHQNVGDFAALSTTVSNVVIDPTLDYGEGPYAGTPQVYFLVLPSGQVCRVASVTNTTIVLVSPPGFTAVGQVFSVVTTTKTVFRGQTYNVHPYPLDRETEVNNT